MPREIPGCLRSAFATRWFFLAALGALAPLLSPSAGAQDLPPAPQERPAASRPLTLEDRGDLFMARKEYADAIDYYTRALKRPESLEPVLWNKIGIAYEQQSKLRQAEKSFQKAMRLKKDFPEAWNNLGTVYYQENRYGKSVRYYRRAIELRPDSASFHLNLGTSYYHLKKIPQTFEEYHTALELDPTCLTTHSAAGTVVQARGADADYFFYLAKVFASLGRAEEAVRYLRRAFEDGFKDHKRLEDDPDFQKISKDPAYIQLVKSPPIPIQD